MDLPTYTNIWRIEKRLYKLYDFRLPMPLPVGTFGVALGIFLIWVVLLNVLNAPFDFGNGWHLVLWVVPPGVITVLATRPVIEGKRLTELLISHARFFTEPRVMTRLAPEYEPGEVRVSVRVWHRSADAGPLPLPRRRRAETEHGAEETHEARDADAAADVVVPDAPPLRGIAGPAKATPVRAEPPEQLYTPAETVRTGRAGSAAGAPARSIEDLYASDDAAGPTGTERAEAAGPAARGTGEYARGVSAESHEANGAVGTTDSASAAAEDDLHGPPGTGHREDQGPGDAGRPEPEGPREPARPRARERVPVFAAAAPVHGADHGETSSAAATAPASAAHEEYREAGPRSSAHAAEDHGPGQDRRSVGRKMLNYFGFALDPGPAEPSGGHGGRGRGDGTGDAGSFGRSEETGGHGDYGEHEEGQDEGFDGFEEPVFVTEEDEDRDRDEWFASLRASSGHTPVGLTSKGAYTTSDTGPMSSEELAEATRDAGRDEGTGTRQESAPARRLRGRTQGIRVVRELEERRSGTERPEASGSPERVREPAPERRRARGQGQALPAEAAPSDEGGTGVSGDPGQQGASKRRPHAAPWELDRDRESGTSAKGRKASQTRRGRREQQGAQGTSGDAERSDFSDLSDYAAQYAAATGRPTVDTRQTSWLPPASGTPDDEGSERRSASRGGRPGQVRGEAGEPHGADHTDHTDHTDDPDHTDDTESTGRAEHPARPEGAERTDPAARTTDVHATTEGRGDAYVDRPHTGPVEDGQSVSHEEHVSHGARAEDRKAQEGSASDRGPASGQGSGTGRNSDSEQGSGKAADGARPELELDHGTGEHSAMPFRLHEDPDAHGPEWNEHMSVLDNHLSKADTPPPPRPKFADAVPGNERGPEPSEAAWFDDGRDDDPDQPRAGDRGNPVISARELRERDRRAQGAEGRDEIDAAEDADEAEGVAGADQAGGTAETVETPEAAGYEGTTEDTGGKATAAPESSGNGNDGSRSTARPEPTDTAEATGGPGTAAPKPPTQLDHGTGELASFSEVRGERSASTSAPETPHRRTADELERAETRALEERRRAASARPGADQESGAPSGPRASGGPRPSEEPRPVTGSGAVDDDRAAAGGRPSAEPEGTPAEDHGSEPTPHTETRSASAAHPRAHPSLAALARDRSTTEDQGTGRADGTGTPASDHEGRDHEPAELSGRSGGTVAAPATGSGTRADPGPGTEDTGDGEDLADDPHDGVFHRVAQNARRLGQLFGQPSPEEDPDSPERETKPELELDHGTGEQERLGDTPNGVPAHRPDRTGRPEARPDSGGTRGWRRLARVVTGGNASTIRSDLPDSDIERLRTPLPGPRNLVVLGCTGGAGQTVTGLMIGHTLAAHRDDRVVAVDVNPGPNGLSRRVGVQTPETLTALLANADGVQDYEQMRSYVSRAPTGLEVVQTLDDPYVQTLDDRDYGQLADLLGGFYGITLMDPAATGVSRALPGADGLILVAPASADAERAVSMTFEWLDGNGYSSLRANSVLVVNGVSKRSLPDVDAAERVARGRCRAIVRVPWDDHLGASYTRIDVGALRAATKRAHGALGGVLVRGVID